MPESGIVKNQCKGGGNLKDFYSVEQNAVLQEIRKYLALKEKYAPVFMSAEEFGEWQKHHGNYFIHKGYLSIWDDIAVPPGYDEVVIQKKRTRDGVKPYLIFRDAEAFQEYCRNAHFLGAASVTLLDNKLISLIESEAEKYRVPKSAYDDLQSELEKFAGLNFTADVSVVSDAQLYGSLYNYYKKGVAQKAAQVFKKYGIIIDIDISEWESTLSLEECPEIAVVPYTIDDDADKIDLNRLLLKVIGLMDKLGNENGSKFDRKDSLLRQVVCSERATDEFISSYYASLKDRRSVWRPIAFSYQVHFAHENGMKYLKNPAFIQACSNVSIGEMIESQIHTYKAGNISEKALSSMYSVSNRVHDENIQSATLLRCAGNPEQIGKALSKELRTEEAKCSLAKALLVSALEKSEAAYFADVKGEEYHE